MSELRRSAKKPAPEKQRETLASDGNSSVKRETPFSSAYHGEYVIVLAILALEATPRNRCTSVVCRGERFLTGL